MAAGKTEAGDMIAGKPIEMFYEQLQRKADRLPPALAGVEYEKLAFLEDLMQQPSFSDAVKRIDNEAIVPWAKALESKYQPAGSLYKVDLPDEAIAKMLDWDKPLSQQPDVVKTLQKEYAPSYIAQFMDRPGSDLYKAISGGSGVEDLRASGAAELAKQGIPGIRYLDGGSRSAGQGSSNYVVFPGNENMLRILERNGQALK
jgi:hypothetical protein